MRTSGRDDASSGLDGRVRRTSARDEASSGLEVRVRRTSVSADRRAASHSWCDRAGHPRERDPIAASRSVVHRDHAAHPHERAPTAGSRFALDDDRARHPRRGDLTARSHFAAVHRDEDEAAFPRRRLAAWPLGRGHARVTFSGCELRLTTARRQAPSSRAEDFGSRRRVVRARSSRAENLDSRRRVVRARRSPPENVGVGS